MGDTVSLKDAEDHIFGLVLLNGWSASCSACFAQVGIQTCINMSLLTEG